MSVQWGFLKFKANAQKCYDELTEAYGEEFTAEQVLDLAENSSTELHKCFQWDDEKAARSWRLEQARAMCRSFTVVIETSEKKEPQAFRLVQHDKEEKVYRPVVFTVRNEDQYEALLRKAKDELASFKRRYKSIVELEKVIDEIDAVLSA